MKSRAVVLQVVVITVFAAPLLVCMCFGRVFAVFGTWEGRLYVYIALETKEEEEEEEDDDDGDNDDNI
jgi:hypothetical protein